MQLKTRGLSLRPDQNATLTVCILSTEVLGYRLRTHFHAPPQPGASVITKPQ